MSICFLFCLILRHSNVINIVFGVNFEVEDGGEEKVYLKMNVGQDKADSILTKGGRVNTRPGSAPEAAELKWTRPLPGL